MRLPFLDMALQWDDFNYLTAAQHALNDPLHPSHVQFVFQGEVHDMRGHPHPPGAAWTLALLWKQFGSFDELRFHAAYLAWNLCAVFAMLALARRFVPSRAVEAALLLVAVPAFAVSGTSFESDLPFLACWLASIAFLIEAVECNQRRWLAACAAFSALAGLYAYQAVFLLPLFALYLLLRRHRDPAAWLCAAMPLVTIGGYQLLEKLSSGDLPATLLTGHFQTYGLQRIEMKLKNAVALLGHLAFVAPIPLLWAAALRVPKWTWMAAAAAACAAALFAQTWTPLLLVPAATGLLALAWTFQRRSEHPFLAGWILLFFAAALVIFFAGAARYLLPLAPALALLLCLEFQHRPALLRASIALQFVLAFAAAWVNASHWNMIRDYVRSMRAGPTYVSAEWGTRWYAQTRGSAPLLRHQALRPGDSILTSQLSGEVPYTVGGGELRILSQRNLRPRIPLRIAGIEARSSYATVAFGLLPFDFNHGVVDRLTLYRLFAMPASASWLPMAAPEARWQIVSGVFGLEENAWRWAQRKAEFKLKTPPQPAPLVAEIFIPEASPARRFLLRINAGAPVEIIVPGPGPHLLSAAAPRAAGETQLMIEADRDFQPSGDSRRLSFIVRAVGYKP